MNGNQDTGNAEEWRRADPDSSNYLIIIVGCMLLIFFGVIVSLLMQNQRNRELAIEEVFELRPHPVRRRKRKHKKAKPNRNNVQIPKKDELRKSSEKGHKKNLSKEPLNKRKPRGNGAKKKSRERAEHMPKRNRANSGRRPLAL
ncbi:hypothetical protein ANCCAN_00776 [Ancylostoma caninum]|uniref:Uncharacterized protein n=1 Tax=Ancylostoma caninum TaxID=29170 RepID=A0A368HC53_ANCCA|nr:hypothetical protein ANCCAN_00776 [Ancylostoma caninum]